MTEYFVNTHIYPNSYQVSNKGTVRNSKTGHILKPRKTKDGYMQVCLMEKGVGKWVYVHRLVATAFVPNIFEVEEVDHINGNRVDNLATNLRWASSKWNKENPITRIRTKYRKTDGGFKPVYIEQYTKEGEFVTNYSSIKKASEATGICPVSISLASRGKTKTAGGYVWKRNINTSYKQTE